MNEESKLSMTRAALHAAYGNPRKGRGRRRGRYNARGGKHSHSQIEENDADAAVNFVTGNANRGRGDRGGYRGRGRGGKYNVICHTCGKPGHKSYECPDNYHNKRRKNGGNGNCNAAEGRNNIGCGDGGIAA